MRLLIAADIFPPQSGGPATYCVTLANELVNEGWKVRIVTHNPKADKSKVNCEVSAVWFKNKLFRYINYFSLLFIHSFGVNVIYAMGPVNAGWPASVVAWITRKRFVVKVVGDYAWEQGVYRFNVEEGVDEFQKKDNYSLIVGILKFIEKMVVKRAEAVIVPSVYLNKMVEIWGCNKDKIKLIYNDAEFIPTDPIKHQGEKWLVSVGRLMPWKGMETLIDVISDISKQYPESGWKLKIVGDGPEMENLKKKVNDCGLAGVVQLTGRLPNKETLTYIASADVFILNSAYEGFSHVLIEAHNQGVPVLASRAGGNEEMVAGDNLFEYNNKEEIKEKVLFNGSLARGRKIPHRFSTDMIGGTKEVLQGLCAS